MQNTLFYMLTIVIWGSTWIAIKFQLGTVDPMVSVAYRFSLAAIVLIAWCFITRRNMKFTSREHGYMALQGAFLFSINYWMFYVAELHLTSGLAAIIFSTILIMNIINGALILKSPVDMKVIAGGALGLVGIVLVFKPELADFDFGQKNFSAMMLCVGATYFASLGNILSARNQKHGLPVIQTNAFGMAYGAVFMLATAVVTGREFDFVMTIPYMGALVYLAMFGSILAFYCYLTLVGNIGADRAAYATLLFPIVALIISTIWEDYQWSMEAITGVCLILGGNLLLLRRKAKTASVQNR